MISAQRELGVDLEPTRPDGVARYPVIFAHGAGSNGMYCLEGYGRQGHLTRRIVDAGHRGYSGNNGGVASWGNAADMAALDAQFAALQAFTDVVPGKVALVASSMGAAVALNWAARNPAKVVCIVTTIPVINITDIHANNRWGFASAINTAHGGWSEVAKGALWNPLTRAQAGAFVGIPMRLTYGVTDNLCLASYTEAFGAAVGETCTLVPLAGKGHEEASYAAVDHAATVAFILEHTEV